jgi:hypothetical protein
LIQLGVVAFAIHQHNLNISLLLAAVVVVEPAVATALVAAVPVDIVTLLAPNLLVVVAQPNQNLPLLVELLIR